MYGVKLGYVVVLHKAALAILKYSIITKYRFQLIFQLLRKSDNEEVFIQLLNFAFLKQ